MTLLSVDQIDYRIPSDGEAIIEFCNDSITTVFGRNCIAFDGNCFLISHLRTSTVAKTILVPYSVHTILRSRTISPLPLKSLVFEFGSELKSIAPYTFYRSPLKSIFSPPSVSVIGSFAFCGSSSLSCVHFDCDSSLWQLGTGSLSWLNSDVFSL
jgi:hypothetical protein